MGTIIVLIGALVCGVFAMVGSSVAQEYRMNDPDDAARWKGNLRAAFCFMIASIAIAYVAGGM